MTAPIGSIVASGDPDHRYFAQAHDDGKMLVWDSTTIRRIGAFPTRYSGVPDRIALSTIDDHPVVVVSADRQPPGHVVQ